MKPIYVIGECVGLALLALTSIPFLPVLVLLFLLLSTQRSKAAGNTNILGAWIEPDGMTINSIIGGDTTTFNTNVQFYSGLLARLDTNYSAVTGTQKCTLTVTSSGWNADGTSKTVTRTVYATKIRRQPYPSHTTNWVYGSTEEGTNLHVRIALSDYIYAGETVTMTTRTGWIVNTNSGTDAAVATALTVTNESALNFGDHSEPSINWAHPGQQRWTNAVEYVYLDGGHWSGIAGIKVEATEGVNTQTVWAVHKAIRISENGQLHGLYVAAIPTSTFSNFASVRIDYIVYPMIGTNVFDTRLDRFTGLTPLPSSQTNFWDRFNSFTNFAIVGLPIGSSPVVTNGAPENVHPDNYFGSIDAAFAALVLTNRNSIGVSNAIGRVLARAGVTNLSGGTATAGPVPPSWAILANYPGDLLVITNISGDTDVADCFKLEADRSGGGGIKLAMPNNQNMFAGIKRLWLDGVEFDTVVTLTCFFDVTHISMTDVKMTRYTPNLIPNTAALFMHYALFRDVDFSGNNGTVWFYTMIGATKRGLTNGSFQLVNTRNSSSGHGAAFAAHNILTDSSFLQLSGALPIFFGGSVANKTFTPTNDVLHGMWVENNVVETTNASASTTFFSEGGNTTNVVFKNNTFRGPRHQALYNVGTNWWHMTPRFLNNIWQNVGFANDLLPQGKDWLTNNLGHLYQVGSSGNVYSFPTGAATHNWPDFDGINNIIPGLASALFPTNLVKFQRMAAWMPGGEGVQGDGDYRLTTDNFLFSMPGVGALPTRQPDRGFDKNANPRREGAPPGAFVDGDPIMTGLMF